MDEEEKLKEKPTENFWPKREEAREERPVGKGRHQGETKVEG